MQSVGGGGTIVIDGREVEVNMIMGTPPDISPASAVSIFKTLKSSASNATKVRKAMASLQQLGEVGTSMAGKGAKSGRAIDDVARLVNQYGGTKAGWAKMKSSSYKAADGMEIAIHWYENAELGLQVEHKTKMTSWWR